MSQPSIQFSYKAQVDDAMEEENVSLPHQQSFSSLKTDSDYIYQVHSPCFHLPPFHPKKSALSASNFANRSNLTLFDSRRPKIDPGNLTLVKSNPDLSVGAEISLSKSKKLSNLNLPDENSLYFQRRKKLSADKLDLGDIKNPLLESAQTSKATKTVVEPESEGVKISQRSTSDDSASDVSENPTELPEGNN